LRYVFGDDSLPVFYISELALSSLTKTPSPDPSSQKKAGSPADMCARRLKRRTSYAASLQSLREDKEVSGLAGTVLWGAAWIRREQNSQ
jgi:hypothetical protein